MNFTQFVMIMVVIVVTIGLEYVILTGDYATIYKRLPPILIPKGKMCTMNGTFIDYMGRPLSSKTVECNTCTQYMSKDLKLGSCRQMQFDGAVCSEYGDSRKCPTS